MQTPEKCHTNRGSANNINKDGFQDKKIIVRSDIS